MSRQSLRDEAVHGELSLAEWFALPEEELGEDAVWAEIERFEVR